MMKILRPLRSQLGQSMAECIIVLPVALLLIFGAIQFALIYHAKITLNYAAFEAARAGSLNNAEYLSVKEGFTRGLAPLYSYYEPDREKRQKRKSNQATNQVAAFQLARTKIFKEFEDKSNLVRIERLSPDKQDFSDFAVDKEIPNDNLMYRASTLMHRSSSTIQDANALHLRITYWYPLYVPLVNRLIFFSVCNTEKWANDLICQQDKNHPTDPRVPLTVVAVMRMQSPAKKSEGYLVAE
jgi:hypothetical protein